MTRTRRSLYALAASYAFSSVALLSGLIATPLLIVWLGEERLGVVKVAQQWLGYALLLNMGLDATISMNFVNASARQDRAGMVAALRGAIRAYVTVALASMAWIGVLWLFAPTFFNLQTASLLPELRWGLLIMLAGQLALLLAALKPMAEAEQRGYVSHLCLTAGSLSSLGLSLLLAYSGYGLGGQFLAIAAAPLVSGVLMGLDALRRYPELLHFRRGQATVTVASFSAPMLVYQVCSRLSFISDCIIIDQIRGTPAVLPFTTTGALLGIVQIYVLCIGNASWPALANLYKQGLTDAFHHRLVQLTRLVAMLTCATIIPSAAWNQQFVLAWVNKPHLYGGDLLTWLLTAGMILATVNFLWALPFVPMGKVGRMVPLFLVGTVLALVLSLLGTWQFGILGPALALLVNMALVMIPRMPRLLEREFGTPARALWRAMLGPLLLGVPYAVGLALLAAEVDVSEWISGRLPRLAVIAALIGGSAVIYLVPAFWLVLPAEDRREWLHRLLARFRRGSA